MWNGKMALVGFEPFTGICFCSSVVYPLSNQSVKQQLSLRSPSDPSPKINKLLFPVHHILQPQIQIRILVLSCMLYHRGGVQILMLDWTLNLVLILVVLLHSHQVHWLIQYHPWLNQLCHMGIPQNSILILVISLLGWHPLVWVQHPLVL